MLEENEWKLFFNKLACNWCTIHHPSRANHRKSSLFEICVPFFRLFVCLKSSTFVEMFVTPKKHVFSSVFFRKEVGTGSCQGT